MLSSGILFASLRSSAFLATLNLVVQLPDELSQPEREALLFSCSQALDHEDCTTVDTNQKPEARIERVSSELYLLELTLETSTGHHVMSREFVFKQADDLMERARSLGLTLGILASEAQATAAPNQPPAPAPSPASLIPEVATNKQGGSKLPTPKSQSKPGRLFVELDGGVGYEPGLNAVFPIGEVRIGYQTATGFSINSAFYLAGSRTQTETGPLSVQYLAPLLGIGYHINFGDFYLGLEAEAGFERVSASTPASTKAAIWATVMRLGVPLRYQISPHSYASVSGRLSIYPSRTEIYLNSVELYQTAPLRPLALVGFGFNF